MAHLWDAFLDLAALQGLTNVDETKVTAESDKPTDASQRHSRPGLSILAMTFNRLSKRLAG